ncbi:Uncharacterised protein [Bordetella pertussis]|nr:Uncharacterised protein [Bordetella pertussis]
MYLGSSAPSRCSRSRELTPSAPITISASSTEPSAKCRRTTSSSSSTRVRRLLNCSRPAGRAAVIRAWKSPRCTVRYVAP